MHQTPLRLVAALAVALLWAPAELRADILYISDISANAVFQLDTGGAPRNGTTNPLPNSPGSPTGVALDPSGNLYVADQSSNPATIFMYQRVLYGNHVDAGTFLAPVVYATGSNLAGVSGIAFDSLGNLYAASLGNGSVVRIGPGGGGTNPNANQTVIVGPNTLSFPEGVAVGPTGLVYVAPFFGTSVNVYDRNGTAIGTISTGGYQAFGLTFDQVGNLYISEQLNGQPSRVVQQPIGSNGLATGTTNTNYGGFGLVAPEGMGFDAQGNLFVADAGATDKSVDKIPPGGGTHSVFGDGFANPTFLVAFATPEPSSLALLSMAVGAMLGYGWWGWRRRRLALLQQQQAA
jgi:hypothetical protein